MQNFPNEIWENQGADGNDTATWITRFFHNKFSMLASDFSRCHFYYLSPDYLAKNLTIIGVIFWMIGIWFLFSRKNKLPLLLVFLSPLLIVFELPTPFFAPGELFIGIQLGVCLFAVISIIRKYVLKNK